MTTQQQIDDPGQWRVGDDVSVTFEDGATLTGKLRERFNGGEMWVGDRAVRYLNGESIQAHTSATVTVTRTVEPLPEPTVPWALVRFADGAVLWRWIGRSDMPWLDCYGTALSWGEAVENHGAPAAVSLPRWSDEVDGLRARVENLAAVFDAEAADFRSANVNLRADLASGYATRLRALLAEGGEA